MHLKQTINDLHSTFWASGDTWSSAAMRDIYVINQSQEDASLRRSYEARNRSDIEQLGEKRLQGGKKEAVDIL